MIRAKARSNAVPERVAVTTPQERIETMLQFHGSLAEISSALKEEKAKAMPNEAYIYYLTALWNYRYFKAVWDDKKDIQRLGEAATLACIEFNKTL